MPKYAEEVMRRVEEEAGDEPGLFTLVVYHDDWCSLLSGGECNCEPVVGKLRKEKGDE